MDGLSHLFFQEPLVAGFYNNNAAQGSAVCSQPIQIWPSQKYSLSNVTSINISLYFSNNTIDTSEYKNLLNKKVDVGMSAKKKKHKEMEYVGQCDV